MTDANQTKNSSVPPTGNNNAPRLAATTEMGLRATCLSKAYKKRPVLRNVSFKVDRGEAVGLLGPNGAGKTTSFYCITGLITPDSGTVTVDGIDVTSLPMYRRARLGIGYLPQEASIFRSLNVENNIRAILEIAVPFCATCPLKSTAAKPSGCWDRTARGKQRPFIASRG